MMNNCKKYLWMLVAALSLFCAVACNKEEEEEETKPSMTGTIKFDLPTYIPINELRQLTASGITYPEKVDYKWMIKAMYSDTLYGESVIVRFPDSLGTFVVTSLATADGYYVSTTSKETTTVDTTALIGSLQGLSVASSYFVDPRDKKTYGYETIGKLDWFTENLAWEGCGAPFKSSEIMTHIFGRYYSWNEATGGVSADGLGAGPQGACPPGWSVPTNADWVDLATAMNDGKELKFHDLWVEIGERASAIAYFNETKMWEYWPDNLHTNDFYWNGLPCGYSLQNNGNFKGIYEYGMWWSATEKDASKAYYRYIYMKESSFPASYGAKNDYGMTVRCVRIASE
ncbi:MAG: hypothetical protein HUJ92_00750 [Bacteroidales bacterium]|nr:hypothetical protein [Bacteroidales bacterium]